MKKKEDDNRKKELVNKMRSKYIDIKKEMEFTNKRLIAINTHQLKCYIDGTEENLNQFLNITADELEARINELRTKSIEIKIEESYIPGQKVKDFLFNVLRVRFIKYQVSKILELVFYVIFKSLGFSLNEDKYSDFDISQKNRKLDVKAVKPQEKFGFDTDGIINDDSNAKNQLLKKLCEKTYNKNDNEEKIFFIIISKTDNESNRVERYVDFFKYIEFLIEVKDSNTLKNYYFETKNKNNQTIKGYAFFFITD